jgi:hypothetical protein
MGTHLYIIGEFDLDDIPVGVEGSNGPGIYRGVKITRIGEAVEVNMVPKFDGVTDKQVQLIHSPNHDYYFIADKGQHITGNSVGLYRYDQNGNRDNTLLTSAMTDVADKVLPFDDGSFIVCSVYQGFANSHVMIRKFNPNGSPDPLFLPIKLTDYALLPLDINDITYSKDENGNVDGFYITYSNVFGQQINPVINDTVTYPEIPGYTDKYFHILPVLKFTLNGALDTNFNGRLKYFGKSFMKPVIELNYFKRLFTTDDGILLFNKVANPITQLDSLVGLAIDREGNVDLLHSKDYNNLPVVTRVENIIKNNDSYIASVIVEEVTDTDTVVELSKILAFDSRGLLTGTFMDDVSDLTIKDIGLFKN